MTIVRAAEEVGDLSDAKNIDIRGAETFAADEIRSKLGADFELQRLAFPDSQLQPFVALLQDKVAEGYRRAGFAEVKVAAKVDPRSHKVVVTVAEGRRFVWGEIRIEGAKAIPVAELARLVTTRRPKERAAADWPRMANPPPLPAGTAASSVSAGAMTKLMSRLSSDNKPAWDKGKPAPFDRETRKTIRGRVKDALAYLGFYQTWFHCEVAADSSGTTASLLVSVYQEGPKATVEKIDVFGNRRNTRDEIIGYLGVKAGMPLDAEQCRRWEHKLWLSGRFANSEVTAERTIAHDGGMQLIIDLSEYEKVPRLSEPLSPAEQALLKCRQQLADSSRWPGDFVVRLAGETRAGEFVVAPGHGSLLLVRDLGPAKRLRDAACRRVYDRHDGRL